MGISEKAMPGCLNLAGEILQRAKGSDIPFNIIEKVGAVLNAKNKERLHSIKQLAQEVLDSASEPDNGDKQVEPLVEEPRHLAAEDIAEVATVVIAMLKGKRVK